MHKACVYILPVANAIGNSHLPYSWGQSWTGGAGRVAGVGANPVGKGKVRRLFRIYELTGKSL